MESQKINLLIAGTLRDGGIGVMPTDTMYGIVGSALNKKTVKKIYQLRKRNLQKPMIILIGSIGDLKLFGVRITPSVKKILKRIWPGPVSVVMPVGVHASAIATYRYLHRGTKTLAFRLPKQSWLRSLLKKTGPLVAPSANFEGKQSARTVTEAKNYFSDKIQFYVDGGRRSSKPSTLVMIEKGVLRILRKGVADIHQ